MTFREGPLVSIPLIAQVMNRPLPVA